MEHGSPRFLVPLGLKAWFATLGITRVDEYDWWQETREGDLAITFVPVQHWSKRRLDDANQTLWGGWVVEGEGLRLIHTGDTGYSKDFRDIGERLGPFDMAFIPIGAVRAALVHEGDARGRSRGRADPRGLEGGARDRHALGHVRSLADEPPDEPPAVLARQRLERGSRPVEFDVLKIGETRRLERRRRGRALRSRHAAGSHFSGSGMNSVSPGTGANRPSAQSRFALSIRSVLLDTKFHQR